jgi:hypothetical protein
VKRANEYDDVAKFLAGVPSRFPSDSHLAVWAAGSAWASHTASLDKSWTSLERTRLEPMREWAATELHAAISGTSTVFYPFSGPDCLHAMTLFPEARTYVLAALEPVGELPDVEAMTPDAVDRYLASTARALRFWLNFSFFRTDDMKSDEQNQFNGQLPLLLVFLARSGNHVSDVTRVGIDEEGAVTAGDRSTAAGSRRPLGARIDFVGPDGTERHLYYFSVNLHDEYLRNSPLRRYLDSLGQFNTYLKSASYLMHKDYFSIIRSAILDRSTLVVQDDSGIPYRFFQAAVWDVDLYGVYSEPIPLFREHAEGDLATAYREIGRAKPLPFGIGYNWRQGLSNLLVARKKPRA